MQARWPGLIQGDEKLGMFEDQGISEPLVSRWSFDSYKEQDDGLVGPCSRKGEAAVIVTKRWLLLPCDLEPLAVLYRLSALKDTLAILPDCIPKKRKLVRDELFVNFRSRGDVRHGNVLLLACLRQLRWDDLLSQLDKADRPDRIHSFLSALDAPKAPLIKHPARSRDQGNKSRSCNVITAEYHLEAGVSLASPPGPGHCNAEAEGQRLQHEFWRISERVQRLEGTTCEMLCELEDLGM